MAKSCSFAHDQWGFFFFWFVWAVVVIVVLLSIGWGEGGRGQRKETKGKHGTEKDLVHEHVFYSIEYYILVRFVRF